MFTILFHSSSQELLRIVEHNSLDRAPVPFSIFAAHTSNSVGTSDFALNRSNSVVARVRTVFERKALRFRKSAERAAIHLRQGPGTSLSSIPVTAPFAMLTMVFMLWCPTPRCQSYPPVGPRPPPPHASLCSYTTYSVTQGAQTSTCNKSPTPHSIDSSIVSPSFVPHPEFDNVHVAFRDSETETGVDFQCVLSFSIHSS